MIHHLTGTVSSTGSHSIIMTINGWGVEVFVSSPHLYSVDTHTYLYTVLQWNQETGPQIFGFQTTTERSLFSFIVSCQGVGPKLALTLLRHIPTDQFLEALQQGNIDKLSSVKGLGPKKAEMLILHARTKRDNITAIQQQLPPSEKVSHRNAFEDVYQALCTLHYTSAEITPILQSLHQDNLMAHASFDILMRKALSLLSRPTK